MKRMTGSACPSGFETIAVNVCCLSNLYTLTKISSIASSPPLKCLPRLCRPSKLQCVTWSSKGARNIDLDTQQQEPGVGAPLEHCEEQTAALGKLAGEIATLHRDIKSYEKTEQVLEELIMNETKPEDKDQWIMDEEEALEDQAKLVQASQAIHELRGVKHAVSQLGDFEYDLWQGSYIEQEMEQGRLLDEKSPAEHQL